MHLKEAIVDMDVFVAEFEKVAGAPRVAQAFQSDCGCILTGPHYDTREGV